MFARIVLKGANRLRQNKLLSTIYHELRLRRASLGQGTPILVYQMGKVGSNSILDSIKSTKLDRPLFHIHFLNPTNIQNAGDRLRKHFGNSGSVNRWALYESRFVIEHFLRPPAANLKIISLVREPISRNVSSFFSNLDLFIPDFLQRFERGEIGIPEITCHFVQDFHEHTYPLTWFDDEIKSVFDIDVFSDENLVKRSRGVYLFVRGGVNLLVLRTEDINEVAVPALREFLGIDLGALRVANDAQNKDYKSAYSAFKHGLRLSEDYLAKMYESKYVKRFYSASEVNRFRSSWSRY